MSEPIQTPSLPWQDPPEPIRAILDRPAAPWVYLSPDRERVLEVGRPGLPPVRDLSEPRLKLAGLKLNPRTHAQAPLSYGTSLALRPLRGGPSRRVPLPEGARITAMGWSPDLRRLAFALVEEEGLSLWVVELDGAEARRLTGPILNSSYGRPYAWLPGDEGLLIRALPEDHGPPPEDDPVPAGPLVEENLGRHAPARTYAHLLATPHDRRLFEHMLTAELHHVDLAGRRRPLLGPALLSQVSPSPDGRFVLVKELTRPFSTQVPAARFPARFTALDRHSGERVTLARLPLADDVPVPYASVRRGRRRWAWRPDRPATLWWIEALDDGDAGRPAEHRDALGLLEAPFGGPGEVLWRSAFRMGGVSWCRGDLAMATEWWYDTRRLRTWRLAPDHPERPPALLSDRNYQDAYKDPGQPLMTRGPFGRSVLKLDETGALLLAGHGASEEGVRPFLDRMDPETGQTTRLWRCEEGCYERVVDRLEDGLITQRQSRSEPPNYLLRPAGGGPPHPITRIPDPVPELAQVHKEILRYRREDGVELSGTLYLPPAWEAERDGPLPTLLWAYPREHRSRTTASQVTTSEHTFSRPSGASPLFLLTRGYAVLAGPRMPIVGEGEEEPNDRYVEQLVSSAEAAVAALVDRGVTDPGRVAIGGHSYGAFTAANLLAWTDLFRCAVARSGAYNRSLTPFGFQGEQRTWWQATDTYVRMSPFNQAHRIKRPILLIHGAEDSNTGTWPIQSERMYEALRGLGGTARWVQLPLEDHGYRSREGVGHCLWEMARWLDIHLAPEAE